MAQNGNWVGDRLVQIGHHILGRLDKIGQNRMGVGRGVKKHGKNQTSFMDSPSYEKWNSQILAISKYEKFIFNYNHF